MIHCVITSPRETVIYKDGQSVILPVPSGQTQVLPGHAESFMALSPGNIVLSQANGKSKIIKAAGGECYIKDDSVLIIL